MFGQHEVPQDTKPITIPSAPSVDTAATGKKIRRTGEARLCGALEVGGGQAPQVRNGRRPEATFRKVEE
jgi:hypothetical protein